MEITDHSLQEAVINKSRKTPVVVQFYAPWCGPCRALKPVIQQVHKTSKHKWDLVFANVKEYPALAKRFNIFSIPDVKLIKNGEVAASFNGYKSEHIIHNWLDSNLEASKKPSPSYTPIEFYLNNNEIEKAKEGLLELAIKETPKSEHLKLLMALQHLGSNNTNAMQWIQKIARGGDMDRIIKKVRDLIDIDIEDKNPSTPTSSPYTIEPEKAASKINIPTFDATLLANLINYGVNEVRQRKGVGTLEAHSILNQAALDQNNYQIQADNLTHYQNNPAKKTVKERVLSFGGKFLAVGENVQFKGFPIRTWGASKEIITPTYIEAAEELIQNWIDSPGHYKNMINPSYVYVGTAVGWNPENNAIFATQVFGG